MIKSYVCSQIIIIIIIIIIITIIVVVMGFVLFFFISRELSADVYTNVSPDGSAGAQYTITIV